MTTSDPEFAVLAAAYRKLFWSVKPEDNPGWVVFRLLERRAPVDRVTRMRDAGIEPDAWHSILDCSLPEELWHWIEHSDTGDAVSFARAWQRYGDEVLIWQDLLGRRWSVIWRLLCAGFPLDVVREVYAIRPEVAPWLYMVTNPSTTKGNRIPVAEIANWVRADLVRALPDSLFKVDADYTVIFTWRNLLGDRAHRYAAAGFSMADAVAAEAAGGWAREVLSTLGSLRA